MTSFRFSCESLLPVRRHDVAMVEAELSQTIAFVTKLEGQVSLVNERRRVFQAERRSLQMRQPLDVSLAAQADRVGDQLRFELIHAQRQLEVARDRLSELRDACQAARSALKSLEQLKDREFSEWRQRSERVLQRESEDAWRLG